MQPNNVNILITSYQSKPQGSSKSVVEPDSKELLPTSKSELKETSNPYSGAKAKLGSNFHKRPAPIMCIFDGRKVVLTLHKNFILDAWAKIHAKLSDLNIECASSIAYEVQVILLGDG